MKSLLKFTLLTALIISGKLAKQAAPAVMAQTVETKAAPNNSMVFVHQVTPANEEVKPTRQQAQPQQSNASFVAEMF